MELTGQNSIAGQWSGHGHRFKAENPALGVSVAPDFFEASPTEINDAIIKAEAAFEIYRHKSGIEKAILLETIADEIFALGDSLIQRCMIETGLPEARLIGERGRTMSQLKLFEKTLREGSWVNARIDTAEPDRKPLPKADIRSMLRPLGPVGIFGASNFPLAFSVAGGDTTSALAAGCPVVFKAHPAHPGTCEMIAMAINNAIAKTKMPHGIFSMVHGASIEVGLAIVKHPLIKAIGFTGSYRGGKAIFDEAHRREVPIPVYAEMGSTNPVFILPGALKEKNEIIARDLATSVTQGVGQFCTNPGLVLVEKSEDSAAFGNNLSKSMSDSSSGVMLTKVIQHNFTKGLDKLKSVAGVTVTARGKEEGSGYRGVAALLQTSSSHFLKDNDLEEEVFGPSTLLITAENRDHLIQSARKLKGHLTATVHGTEKDLKEYSGLISILEQKVGRIIFNGYPTGVEVCDSMVHGGPFPATTDSRTTSVGTAAIFRFARPVCYQGFPDSMLPTELQDGNPLQIFRLVNGNWSLDISQQAIGIRN